MLEVIGLSKNFGGLRALSDVSFSIGDGEIVGIFGPNGSGKTTLLNTIAGLIRPSAGMVRWRGARIDTLRTAQIAAAGVVKTFQNPQLFPELTVREHLEIAGHLRLKRAQGLRRVLTLVSRGAARSRDLDRQVGRTLELCRMTPSADVPAADLSYGEEKMLGVAMAMMCEPRLILLDEPASGLGRAEIDNLAGVLADLRAEGRSLGIIDHRIRFLADIADRAIALHHGAMIMQGPPEQVLRDQGVQEAYLGRQHA